MKRKFKLFATVASLCLSVALMAFGVYAATTVNYNVSSTVTFAAQVDVIWTADVKDGEGTDLANGAANETADFGPEIATGAPEATKAWAPVGNLSFGTGEDTTDTIVYTFTCTNNGSQAVTIGVGTQQIFTEWATLIEQKDISLTVSEKFGSDSASETGTLTGGSLDASEVYTVEITVVLKDKTVSVPNGNLTINFTAAAA